MASREARLSSGMKVPLLSHALCAETDPDLFFPIDERQIKQINLAKSICNKCDDKNKCLEYALTVPDLDGVWGGLTVSERKALR